MVFVCLCTRLALTSFDRQRCTELRSRFTKAEIVSIVASLLVATWKKISVSMGLRLYRHVSRSWQVAFFLVSSCMLSMVGLMLFDAYKYCVVLTIQ